MIPFPLHCESHRPFCLQLALFPSLRHRFKCGIGERSDFPKTLTPENPTLTKSDTLLPFATPPKGNVRPLALVIALGASFDVVRLMYRACPQALEERLSGQRTLLHYIVSEGASSEVVSFVISKVPSILVSFAVVRLSRPDGVGMGPIYSFLLTFVIITSPRCLHVHSRWNRTHSR